MEDTIFALSSGAPPAAIGVIRISGPGAGDALAALAGDLPPARSPRVRARPACPLRLGALSRRVAFRGCAVRPQLGQARTVPR